MKTILPPIGSTDMNRSKDQNRRPVLTLTEMDRAAKCFADPPCDFDCRDCPPNRMECRHFNSFVSFRAGAAWALIRWNNVKDMLPPKENIVNVRLPGGKYTKCFIMPNGRWAFGMKPTHWQKRLKRSTLIKLK